MLGNAKEMITSLFSRSLKSARNSIVAFVRENPYPCAALCAVFSVLLFRAVFFGLYLYGNHDRLDWSLPVDFVNRNAVTAGQFPFWNRYLFNGAPLWGTVADLKLYPFHAWVYLMPKTFVEMGLTWVTLLHWGAACLVFYVFARRVLKDKPAAFFAMLIFGLSNAMLMQFSEGSFLYHWVWLLIILAIWFKDEISPRDRNLWLPLATALLICSAHVNLMFYSFLTLACVYCLRVMEIEPSRRRPFLAHTAIPGVIGVLVAGIRWHSLMATLKLESLNLHIPYFAFKQMGTTDATDLIRLFAPQALGTKQHEFLGTINMLETVSCYFGIIPLMCLGYVLLSPKEWRRYWPWILIAFFMFDIMLGGPFNYLHYVATGRNEVLYGRIGWFLFVPVPILAGRGLIRLRRDPVLTTALPRLIAVVALGACFAYSVSTDRLPANWFYVPAFIALAGLLTFRFRWFLIAITAADLGFVIFCEYSYSDNLFETHPYFAESKFESSTWYEMSHPITLDEIKSRVGSQGRAILQVVKPFHQSVNRLAAYGILSSSGYDNFPPPLVLQLYIGPSNSVSRATAHTIAPLSDWVAQLTSTVLVLNGQDVRAVANPLPRVSFVNQFVVIPDLEQTYGRLFLNRNLREVVLGSEPGIALDVKSEGVVEAARESANRLEYEVHTTGPGVLLITDTFFPGWSAKVDGLPAELLQANFAFRGVPIASAGDHSIVLTYLPVDFWNSLAISIFGVGLWVAWVYRGAWMLEQFNTILLALKRHFPSSSLAHDLAHDAKR